MNEELREPKEYEEIEDVSDGRIQQMFGRLAQMTIFLVGARYSLDSFVEKGITVETFIDSMVTIGLPVLIEWAIRADAQNTKEAYHEPGVVED